MDCNNYSRWSQNAIDCQIELLDKNDEWNNKNKQLNNTFISSNKNLKNIKENHTPNTILFSGNFPKNKNTLGMTVDNLDFLPLKLQNSNEIFVPNIFNENFDRIFKIKKKNNNENNSTISPNYDFNLNNLLISQNTHNQSSKNTDNFKIKFNLKPNNETNIIDINLDNFDNSELNLIVKSIKSFIFINNLPKSFYINDLFFDSEKNIFEEIIIKNNELPQFYLIKSI